jgi:hypothetical protein
MRRRIARHLADNENGTASGGTTTTITMTGELDRYPVTPQYLLGAEVTHFISTTSTQSRHITTHAKTGGTVTLTVPTWASPVSTDAWEIHEIGGMGFRKSQYDDAINAAIDSVADGYFTDTFNVHFGMERGGSAAIAGQPRLEYPVPASLNYLYALHYLDSSSAAANPFGNAETHRAMGDATARTSLGQGFKVGSSGWYEWFMVSARKVGSPTDNITLAIQSNSSGVPDGTAITNGTSDTIDGSTLDERYRYVPFRFDPPIYLTSGTQYHMVFDRSAAADASNYYQWAEDTGNSYGDGTASVFDNSSWAAVSASDFTFVIYPSSTEWRPILSKKGWDYRRIGNDVLYIPGGYNEGCPIRIAGATAIAEVTTETATVPVRPEYVEAYAIQYLLSTTKAKVAGESETMQIARHWADRILQSPKPIRNIPNNAIRVYA